MRYMYYCPKCGSMYSSEEENIRKECKECSNGWSSVVAYPLGITKEEWTTFTDEQKAEVKKNYASYEAAATKHTSSGANTVGNTIKVFGWIYIVLCVIGFFALLEEVGGLAFAALLFGILGGTLLLGFAEIINLLNDIKNK